LGRRSRENYIRSSVYVSQLAMQPSDFVTFSQYRRGMVEINEEKVDEMALALLYLTTFKDKSGLRAWKTHSWDVLDRLHRSGYIDDPVTKAKSVRLTEEGAARSKRLFEQHFGK
jgi:hypothetical protein